MVGLRPAKKYKKQIDLLYPFTSTSCSILQQFIEFLRHPRNMQLRTSLTESWRNTADSVPTNGVFQCYSPWAVISSQSFRSWSLPSPGVLLAIVEALQQSICRGNLALVCLASLVAGLMSVTQPFSSCQLSHKDMSARTYLQTAGLSGKEVSNKKLHCIGA